MTKAIVHLIALRPYGDRLLTPSASFWTSAAGTFVLTFALLMATGSAYATYLAIHGPFATVAAVLSFCTFSFVSWTVAASLITAPPRTTWLANFLRIALLAIQTLTIAPFIVQAVLARDIDAEIRQRNATAILSIRQEVRNHFDSQLDARANELKRKEDELIATIAGRGPSRRPGYGPAAVALATAIERLRAEAEGVRAERDGTLRAFDSMSQEQLSVTYGVRFLGTGLVTRFAVLQELLKRPEYAALYIAVTATMTMSLIAILGFSLLRPRSVVVYYDSEAQRRAGSSMVSDSLDGTSERARERELASRLDDDGRWQGSEYSEGSENLRTLGNNVAAVYLKAIERSASPRKAS